MENKDLQPEPFNAQKHADRQPQPNWRERFYKQFPAETRATQGLEIERFIAEVESAAEERGQMERGNCYCVCHSEFSSAIGCKHCKRAIEVANANARSSLKAELVEAGEKMKKKVSNWNGSPDLNSRGYNYNQAISDYQSIIKSA